MNWAIQAHWNNKIVYSWSFECKRWDVTAKVMFDEIE